MYIHRTLPNLFFECLDIKDFWLQLNDKLEKSGQMGVNLHNNNILFVEETSSKLQDKIVILAKWYIYQCKYADRMPCCDLFIEWMNKYSDISMIQILDRFDIECKFGVVEVCLLKNIRHKQGGKENNT